MVFFSNLFIVALINVQIHDHRCRISSSVLHITVNWVQNEMGLCFLLHKIQSSGILMSKLHVAGGWMRSFRYCLVKQYCAIPSFVNHVINPPSVNLRDFEDVTAS